MCLASCEVVCGLAPVYRRMQRKPMWLVEVSIASGLACRGPVAQAVARRAQVRAALDHAARDVRRRAGRGRSSLRSVMRGFRRCAAGVLGVLGRAAGRVVVASPLPDVSGHVVEPVAVGGEEPDRGGAAPAGAGVAARESLLARSSPSAHRRDACSSPQAKIEPSRPPRAAYSHSASVGSSLPAHAAYASASS